MVPVSSGKIKHNTIRRTWRKTRHLLWFTLLTASVACTSTSETVQRESSGITYRKPATQTPPGNPPASPPPGIQQSSVDGQYDLLEGTNIQFEGRGRDDTPEVQSYLWEIVSGFGGQLLDADQSKVTFIAPRIDQDVESFLIQLTTTYVSGDPSVARINVNVHRKSSRVIRESRNRVVNYYGPGPWLGFGLGFGFGWAWRYPVYVPIYIPYPGEELLPEEIEYLEAVPLPADDPIFDELAEEGLLNAEMMDALETGYTQESLEAMEAIETLEAIDTMETLEAMERQGIPMDEDVLDALDGAAIGENSGIVPDLAPDIGTEIIPVEQIPVDPGFGGGGFGGFDDFGGGFDDFGGGFDDFGGGW